MGERHCGSWQRSWVIMLALVGLLALMRSVYVSGAQGLTSDERAKMKRDVAITIAYDNNAFDKRLKPDWGFACVIEGLPETILFDTGGRGKILLSNMAKLGLRPEEINVVVLSHIHHDHTGGLQAFLRTSSDVKVLMPKSFPPRFKEMVRSAGATLVETEGPCKVCEGAWTTGVLNHGVEEQGLYLTTPEGLVLITGCAHPGIVRMAKAAAQHAAMPVAAVLGGFHMSSASDREIADVIEGLRNTGVRKVAPCHCSGSRTRLLMNEAFGEGYIAAGVGARLVFRAGPKEEQ